MKAILITLCFFACSITWARQPTDKASEDALKQTQDLLKNRQQRESYIKDHEGAQKVHKNIQDLTGGDAAHTQEMYDIAADVLKVVTEKAKKSNGEVDVEKMKKLMLEYQTNPEAFYRQMTPEQRKRIKALGKKIGPAPASQN